MVLLSPLQTLNSCTSVTLHYWRRLRRFWCVPQESHSQAQLVYNWKHPVLSAHTLCFILRDRHDYSGDTSLRKIRLCQCSSVGDFSTPSCLTSACAYTVSQVHCSTTFLPQSLLQPLQVPSYSSSQAFISVPDVSALQPHSPEFSLIYYQVNCFPSILLTSP